MKRNIINIIIVIMLFCMTACGNSSIQENGDKEQSIDNEVQNNNVMSNKEFFIWDGTMIIGYTEEGLKQTELVIPSECTEVLGLDSNPIVKKIRFENDDTIVSSVTFKNCTSLEEIVLPDNLERLESFLFAGCTSLKTICIPDSVLEIENDVFVDCTSLETVIFGNCVKNIGLSAFENCTSLKNIEFPNSLSTIGNDAFMNCIALKNINFGEGLEAIGEESFRDCDSLKKVILPEGLKSLDIYSFGFCESLEEIYLPSTLESIHVHSLVQVHTIKVYVVKDSYMDKFDFSELTGGADGYYDKQYQ